MTRRQNSRTRRGAFREATSQVLVVCGGVSTEPAYFRGLRKWLRNPAVKVQITAEGIDPKKLVEHAVVLDQRASSTKYGAWSTSTSSTSIQPCPRLVIWASGSRSPTRALSTGFTPLRIMQRVPGWIQPCGETFEEASAALREEQTTVRRVHTRHRRCREQSEETLSGAWPQRTRSQPVDSRLGTCRNHQARLTACSVPTSATIHRRTRQRKPLTSTRRTLACLPG